MVSWYCWSIPEAKKLHRHSPEQNSPLMLLAGLRGDDDVLTMNWELQFMHRVCVKLLVRGFSFALFAPTE
jgi:hypothetical protein